MVTLVRHNARPNPETAPMPDPHPEIDLSKAQTEAEWLARLDELGEEVGWFEPLGQRHAAFHCTGSRTALMVSFEIADEIRRNGGRQRPLGYEIASAQGWASLALVARGRTWFRDQAVWDLLDRLIDEGFFDGFDRVVFFGSGSCGYAAAAYSVGAPGATVIAVAPQATLARDMTEWDTRFPEARRRDFTTRYGYAPDMCDAAERVFVIYDPTRRLDAMHATLFKRPNVTRLRTRVLGKDTAAELAAMGVLLPAIEMAGRGMLTPQSFYRLFRRRHSFGTYLMRLALRTEALGRPRLTAKAARAALAIVETPQLRAMLEKAEARDSSAHQSGQAS